MKTEIFRLTTDPGSAILYFGDTPICRVAKETADFIRKHLSDPMTEAKAREILGDCILPGGKLFQINLDDNSEPGINNTYLLDGVKLDGEFTADQLEAVAWWMRNMGK